MNRTITLFGSSKPAPDSAAFQAAYQMGLLLAQSGFAIANGGYGGTMLASAKGAAQAGGAVYGVTCKAFKRGKANPFVTEEIQTDTLSERLAKLIELGDGYIVLPGGTGTLLELADVWEHKHKGFLPAEKPIVLLGDFWKPLLEMIKRQDPDATNAVCLASDPVCALDMIKASFK